MYALKHPQSILIFNDYVFHIEVIVFKNLVLAVHKSGK
jgi:hypothetical protein